MITRTRSQEMAGRLGVSEDKVQAVLQDRKQVEQLMRLDNLTEEAAVYSLIAEREMAKAINDIVICSPEQRP